MRMLSVFIFLSFTKFEPSGPVRGRTPCVCVFPSRGRRSPRGRRAQPGPGSLPDTDRDRLLTDHSATYRKYPGLNNVAYMVAQAHVSVLDPSAVTQLLGGA